MSTRRPGLGDGQKHAGGFVWSTDVSYVLLCASALPYSGTSLVLSLDGRLLQCSADRGHLYHEGLCISFRCGEERWRRGPPLDVGVRALFLLVREN